MPQIQPLTIQFYGIKDIDKLPHLQKLSPADSPGDESSSPSVAFSRQ